MVLCLKNKNSGATWPRKVTISLAVLTQYTRVTDRHRPMANAVLGIASSDN